MMNCHSVGEEEWDRHHNEPLPSINTECTVTARTNASQRTLCSAHGTAVRLWQAVSHSMSSNGRLPRKFIYSAMPTVEPKREPIVGLMNKRSIMTTCH